jgi:hypothetical protein
MGMTLVILPETLGGCYHALTTEQEYDFDIDYNLRYNN